LENDQIIENAFQKATKQLEKIGDDIHSLPIEIATFLRVYAAQGVFDNGGYRYFFENDWPDNSPYDEFVQAYREIGCTNQADDIDRVVKTFLLSDPHLHLEERLRFIDQNYDEDAFEVKGWGDALCGDATVWNNLAQYVRDHEPIFF
jgi:hypothetical protein